MPPTSKKQAAFLRLVAAGQIKLPGMSAAQADEYVSGHATKGLPLRAVKRGKKKRRVVRK